MEVAPYINSAFLQRKFLARLERDKHDFSFENITLFEKESDIISLKDYVLHEYEVKISESDFRKDKQKKRHQDGKPNFFYFIVPDLNIIKGDYQDYAGIYLHSFSTAGDSLFRLMKEPTRIREDLVNEWELYRLLRKIYNSKRFNNG